MPLKRGVDFCRIEEAAIWRCTQVGGLEARKQRAGTFRPLEARVNHTYGFPHHGVFGSDSLDERREVNGPVFGGQILDRFGQMCPKIPFHPRPVLIEHEIQQLTCVVGPR
jgi:hypothetical protein